MSTLTVTPQAAKRERTRRRMRSSFASYFHATRPDAKYVYGRHTHALLSACQAATMSVESGRSCYYIVNIPFRHGKSDVCSRRYPSWHLMRNPHHELILGSYNFQLAADMSYAARQTFIETSGLFGLSIPRDRGQIGAWGIANNKGMMYAAGIGGTITGRGANVLVIDDYLKNRSEAESETIRNNVWESFQSDLMTRLAPVHAVLIVANRWHQDDLVGRILERNNPKSSEYDPKFPKFKLLKFPAKSKKYGWLFPERFSAEWYERIESVLGPYAWAAMGQQQPRARQGNMLKVANVKFVNEMPSNLRWKRGWDLASTEKQRAKDKPDFTVGTKTAFSTGTLYVGDVVRGQWGATQRDKIMLQTSQRDGGTVEQLIEAVGGYKDTVDRISKILHGRASVRAVHPTTDKVARCTFIEPLFETGAVVVQRAPWNDAWIEELGAFPSGAKNDQVDSLVISSMDWRHEGIEDFSF